MKNVFILYRQVDYTGDTDVDLSSYPKIVGIYTDELSAEEAVKEITKALPYNPDIKYLIEPYWLNRIDWMNT